MPNFVYDTTQTALTKNDPNPGVPPEDVEVADACLAGDWNKTQTRLDDIRTAMRASSFDPRHYGGAPDGSTLNDTAIAAALTAAQAAVQTGQGAALELSEGTWAISKPIVANKSGTTIRGAGKGSTKIKLLNNIGPAVICAPDYGGLELVDPLVSGISGSKAWDMDDTSGDNLQWLNLRADNDYFRHLDGTTAFTFECYLRFPTAPAFTTAITGAWHQRYRSEDGDGFFFLEVTSSAKWTLGMGGNSGIEVDSVASISANTTYHVAATYDGTNARLFVNGTAVITAPLTGGLSFPQDTQWYVGSDGLMFPEGSYRLSSFGIIDSIRISNTARYTSNFTAPTTKLTRDNNTLFLLNFDEFTNAYAAASVGYGGINIKHYVPMRQFSDSVEPLENVALDGLSVEGGGVLVQRCRHSRFTGLGISGGQYGLLMRDHCDYSRAEDIAIDAGATSQLGLAVVQSQPVFLDNITIASAGFAGLVISTSRVVANNIDSAASAGLAALFNNNTDDGSEAHVEAYCRAVSLTRTGTSPECIGILDFQHYAQFDACTFNMVAAGSPNQPPIFKVGGNLGDLVFNDSVFAQPGGSTVPQNIRHLTSGFVPNKAYVNRYRTFDAYTLTAFSSHAGYVVQTSLPNQNPSLAGSVTISDTDDNATVSFAAAQSDANYSLTVSPVPVASTGTPAAGSGTPVSLSKTTDNFTLTVDTAPGSGNSVTFDWQLAR